jgi:hypothetical protein
MTTGRVIGEIPAASECLACFRIDRVIQRYHHPPGCRRLGNRPLPNSARHTGIQGSD